MLSMLLIKSMHGQKQRKDGYFVDKKGRRFKGTCDNYHEKACQWNLHCPGQCDDKSTNTGELCLKPSHCKQGSCIHNQCVKPNRVCANDSGISCEKNKDCKPYKCIIPVGVCDNDSSVTCKGRIDCPLICTKESKKAGTVCTKHRNCGKNGRCGRGHCVYTTESAAPSGAPIEAFAGNETTAPSRYWDKTPTNRPTRKLTMHPTGPISTGTADPLA